MSLLNYIQQFNSVSIILRLVLATFLGALIGLERGSHGQPAGLRTFAIVCLGSCLAMITDEYLVTTYHTGDPARLAAQVISGIGFLGVGTIIVTGKNYVKGLTTAASLWTTATLGITIGSGYIIGGVVGFFLIMLIILFLTKISHLLDEYTRVIKLYIEADKSTGVSTLLDYIQSHSYRLSSIEKQKRVSLQGKDAVLVVIIDLKNYSCHANVIADLYTLNAIHYVEEIH